MACNNILIDHDLTAKIVPLSALSCPQCGEQKTHCHNSFRYFPKRRCTTDFYSQVVYLTLDLEGNLFSAEQYHEKLSSAIYTQFQGITEPEMLSMEMLDVQLDLGVIVSTKSGMFKIV